MLRRADRRKRFNSSRGRLLEENRRFASSVPQRAYVLDAGAGEAPYRHLYLHAHYETADFLQVNKRYAKQTYVCDLSRIPVEDERFDAVLFNQVMEHLPDPEAVLNELFRVLRPGGRLLYTGALFYEEHEKPYDLSRYTQFAVQRLFNRSGFLLERLDWLEGYYATLAYQLDTTARALSPNPAHYGGGIAAFLMAGLIVPLRMVFRALPWLFHRVEMRFKFTKSGYPKNYLAIAERPDRAAPEAKRHDERHACSES